MTPVAISETKPAPPALYRWTVLIFVSLAMFGNYYVYDSISPLADVLTSQLGFTDSNIGLLQGIYSIPNVLMVLLGGILIDRLGTKKSALLFSVICMVGALFTFVKGDLAWMATGRLIFGLGAESLIVASTTIIARWFKGKELSFAFGINLTISRLGTFAALNSPRWARGLYETWQEPLMLAAGFAAISVFSVVVYFILDKAAEKKYILGEEQEPDKVNLKEIVKFNKSFWYITALCVTFYSAIFPFQTFAIKFFQIHHGLERDAAGFVSSMPIFFSMVLTPFFGIISDKVGKRAVLMMTGSFILIPVYLMIYYLDVSLYVPIPIMGISFSLIPAVMWPAVSIVVKDSRLGTAYGLMTMIQNIGLAGFNLLIGWTNDFTGGYEAGMWIFSSLGLFGLFFAFLLRRAETGPNSHGLELSERERAKEFAAK
ncbi:MAG: MFS transporter [Bacteroidota bacterium]